MNAFHAKKRFGQHLLRFSEDARRIASLLFGDSISSGLSDSPPTIVEIGPGTGELTAALVDMYPAARITAVEFDRDLQDELKSRFAGNPSVTFIQEDILKFQLSEIGAEIHLIGNLPYNLSAPIMQWTLQQRSSVRKAVFMLQREVARRLCSEPNCKDWSPLGIQTQLRFHVSPAFDLGPERFAPPPKVHSSVFTLTPRITADDFPEFAEGAADQFEKLVRNAFASRRKTLVNNLMGKCSFSRIHVGEILHSMGFDERIRAEQLSINDFIKLQKAFDTRAGK
jgi:16S rRNA (adenine1518-N6/adenine1519-N6)-dimethyltransferase